MEIAGLKCVQVGQGRPFKRKDGVEVRDHIARCVNAATSGDLGSNTFFDYKLTGDEAKDAKKYEGKMLTLHVDEVRQPYAGAPFGLAGHILKVA